MQDTRGLDLGTEGSHRRQGEASQSSVEAMGLSSHRTTGGAGCVGADLDGAALLSVLWRTALPLVAIAV